MIQGLVFMPPELAGRISRAAFEAGLMAECAGAQGQVLKLLPPLLMPEPELEEALSLLADTVATVLTPAAIMPAVS